MICLRSLYQNSFGTTPATKPFQGIVESKKIFATDLRYLNDSQEFVHARELAWKLADEVLESSDSGVAVSGMFKNAMNLAFNTGPLRADRLQVMVASFSQARDQLSQWRGYSGASSGVSISFDLSTIRPPLGVENSGRVRTLRLRAATKKSATTSKWASLVRKKRSTPSPTR